MRFIAAMPPSPEIRKIRDTELTALLDLYRHLHPEDAPLPDKSIITAVWEATLNDPKVSCFGTFLDGTLVTSCVLTVIPNLTRACRPYGLIENVVTHADYRRKGLGRTLLQHALDHAWKADCYKVMLLSGRREEAVNSFYQSVGFDPDAKQAFVAKNPRS